MTFLFIFNSILLGVGLAMDAFSVSLANGLHAPQMPRSQLCLIALVYAVFQWAMPLLGWFLVHTAAEWFSGFEAWIPWIALALLCYLGGKMLAEGIRHFRAPEDHVAAYQRLTFSMLMVQGVATSIDALSVGFTIASYQAHMALICSLIIGVVTFFICVAGLVIGKKFGTIFSRHASIFGGLILIGIGLEIFIRHIIL